MTGSGTDVTGIILAAGRASRMGRLKQVLPFGRSTLLGEVVRSARLSVLSRIVVVLGHEHDTVAAAVDLAGTVVVVNPRYPDGMSTSLIQGLSAVPETSSAAMILLADQPLVSPALINHLVSTWARHSAGFLVPTCRGRRGNPVIIGRDRFPDVFSLTGDTGARVLFDQAGPRVREIDVDDTAVVSDVDTWEVYSGMAEATKP